MKKFLPLFLFLLFICSRTTPASAQTDKPVESLPSPIGAVVKLDFRIPGIGSESGNLTPLRSTRDVTIYFFAPDVNSSDPTVKSLASVKTQAVYDSESTSPTFGTFVNQNIDLGTDVPDGKYQISFKSSQTLSKLVKAKESAVGGKVFEINKSYGQTLIITGQTVILGDIYPAAKEDNTMDINDYNALVSCFGAKADSAGCADKKAADLDDNGTIDGTDYNLIYGSFKTLLEMGLPVPSIFAGPTKTISKPSITKPLAKPTVTKQTNNVAAKKPTNGGNIFLVILFVFLAIGLVAGVVFFLIKRKRIQSADTDNPPAADQVAPATSENPVTESPEEAIDKDFFVKKQAEDPENHRLVLTLTDDSGPTLGYYSGAEVTEGFSNVKGTLKKDGSKIFIEVSKISPVEETTT